MKPKMKITEKAIERSIIDFLRWKGAFVFKIENGGVYDPNLRAYRFNRAVRLKGIPDIIGVYRGRGLAIEVKTETGRASPDQIQFMEDWISKGGVGIIARSVDDALELIEKIDRNENEQREKVKRLSVAVAAHMDEALKKTSKVD